MKCKHDDGGNRLVRIWDRIRDRAHDVNICSICNHWLPLGPAAADTPEVIVEIEAARIAAHYHDEDYRPGYDRFDWCPETDRNELCAQCETLYLAHAIATHDQTHGGDE